MPFNNDFKEKIFNYASSSALALVGLSWVVMFYSIIKKHNQNT